MDLSFCLGMTLTSNISNPQPREGTYPPKKNFLEVAYCYNCPTACTRSCGQHTTPPRDPAAQKGGGEKTRQLGQKGRWWSFLGVTRPSSATVC